jgi:excisionase family DNA binding protein
VARLLSIARSTVYELIADGRRETVHVGRSARIPVGALIRFVEDLQAQADEEYGGTVMGRARTYKTKTGKVLTEAETDAMAGEAESGYDVELLKSRRRGRPRARRGRAFGCDSRNLADRGLIVLVRMTEFNPARGDE